MDNDVVLHATIHTFSTAAAAIGAGMAQLPGSDAAALVPLQTTMIVTLAAECGVSISRAAAAQMLLPFSAAIAGRAASQWLVGWMPGIGNAINATTAATLTEAIGWAAVAYFRA